MFKLIYRKFGNRIQTKDDVLSGLTVALALVPEAVAFAICSAIGLETNDSATDYIQLHQGDVEKLKASLDLIRDAASEILSAMSVKEPKTVEAALVGWVLWTLTPTNECLVYCVESGLSWMALFKWPDLKSVLRELSLMRDGLLRSFYFFGVVFVGFGMAAVGHVSLSKNRNMNVMHMHDIHYCDDACYVNISIWLNPKRIRTPSKMNC